MDWNRRKQLVEKYWKGETSTAEEASLKQVARNEDSPKEEEEYFKLLDQFGNQTLGDDFEEQIMSSIESKNDSWRMTPWMKMAATVLLVGGMALGISYQSYQSKQIRQQEARIAFETTKMALMMVSSRLNKGTEATKLSLAKIEETQQKISIN